MGPLNVDVLSCSLKNATIRNTFFFFVSDGMYSLDLYELKWHYHKTLL